MDRRRKATPPLRAARLVCVGSLCALVVVLVCTESIAAPFEIVHGSAGITSLKRTGDPFATEFIAPGATLGRVVVRYRRPGGAWQVADTNDLAGVRAVDADADGWRVTYGLADAGGAVLDLGVQFVVAGGALSWRLRLEIRSTQAVEIGDLEVPLPMNERYSRDPAVTMTQRLFRHAFVAGHGSHVYWTRPSGYGHHLLMTPAAGTSLEYFTHHGTDYAWGGGHYSVYVYSAASGGAETRGTWRQEHTSIVLAPSGDSGHSVEHGFVLRWARDLDTLRDLLVAGGGFDVRVIPGMVVPEDLSARFSLRTEQVIRSVDAEFPAATRLAYLGKKGVDGHVWEARFARRGENRITVRWGDGRSLPLEFFVTQPLETLIAKRAAFIATKQQHRDPSKWYDGLFSLWDMRHEKLLGPDDREGQHPYAVSGSDDPSNSKCAYLSEKNVAYPDAKQIAALEYHIEKFVWGKLQRTDREHPHPYALYGCDSWHQCRNSKTGLGSGGHGQERMWRTFDYTTYILLYFNMYRIATQNPDLTQCLDADGYLERAYGTAVAFFTVPYGIDMRGWDFTGWCDWAYTVGNFHERYLVPLIDACEKEGYPHWAARLRGEWEKKVKYFLYDSEYPFASEMPFDSTAYESSHAIARYALTHRLEPDKKLWQDKKTGEWYSHPVIRREDATRFMERQLAANVACRGWLETSYWHLGSDFRGLGSTRYTLSYMSQMGGWAVLDYALNWAAEPADWARLGYASLLSSWALVNSGSEATDFGYWYPGAENDGAVGWAFAPMKFGPTWNPGIRHTPRGIWPVCGEIDHGLTGGIHAAATIVLEDPIFGLVALGGTLERVDRDGGDEIRVVPRDGVRQRLYVRRGRARLDLTLDRDGFARGEAVVLTDVRGGGGGSSTIRLRVESRRDRRHVTRLGVRGLPPGSYRVSNDGRVTQTQVGARETLHVEVAVTPDRHVPVVIERVGS